MTRWLGIVPIVCGVVVLSGWIFSIPVLTLILPGGEPVRFTSAFSFVVGGIGLLLTAGRFTGIEQPQDARSAVSRIVAAICAALCLVAGIAHLAGYFAGFDPAIFANIPLQSGPMSLLSSICFTLLGGALLLLGARRRGLRTLAQAMGVAVVGLSYFALLAASLGSPTLYRLVPMAFLAPVTSLMLAFFGLGVILARRDGAVAAGITSRGPGGTMLRRLLLYSLTVPAVLATLRFRGEEAGYYDLSVGVALLTTANIVLLCAVSWITARSIDRADENRRAADALRAVAEDRYRVALDRMIEGCQIVGFDWRYLYLNRQAGTQAHRDPGELIGRTMTESFPGIEATPLFASLTASMDDRMPRRFENEFSYPDGPSSWFDLSIQPVPEGLFILSVDITERKRAEATLRESERKFGVIFRKVPFAAALSKVPDGVIVDVNEAFEREFGYSREESIGRTTLELGINPDVELRARIISELRERGYARDVQIPMRTRSGEQRLFLVNIDMVGVGDESFFLQTVQDITARKLAEDKVRELAVELEERVRLRTAELEAANKELEAFSYSVSHDLRAPLRHIAGFGELVIRDKGAMLDDDGRRMLLKIQEAATHMSALIDDLLQLSRTSRTEMHVRALDLEAMTRGVIASLQSETANRTIQWDVGLVPPVSGDPSLIRLVIQNLLDNAVKYTRPREKAEISITAARGNHEVVVTVRDNGVGFDKRYTEKLFGVFQRLHGPGEFEGTGIGLANVRRIIQRHGGRTWAEGDVGKGAAFSFSLPVRIEEEEP